MGSSCEFETSLAEWNISMGGGVGGGEGEEKKEEKKKQMKEKEKREDTRDGWERTDCLFQRPYMAAHNSL